MGMAGMMGLLEDVFNLDAKGGCDSLQRFVLGLFDVSGLVLAPFLPSPKTSSLRGFPLGQAKGFAPFCDERGIQGHFPSIGSSDGISLKHC